MSERYECGDPLYDRVRGIGLDQTKPGGSSHAPSFLVDTIMQLHDRLVAAEVRAAAALEDTDEATQ